MKIIIPEIREPGKRLGRNINHDPRSLRFVAEPAKVDKTVNWSRHVPVFDQGSLGSCTGNAQAGLLACDPFHATLPKDLTIDEALAVKLYSLATDIDPYTGHYPPNDTGSDGLSVNKAAQQLGFISGYVWATSVERAMTLIQQGPFIIGSDWTSYMDKPSTDGIIRTPASGTVRGGHEYLCYSRDAEHDLWWFWNSWGAGWGKQGTFAYNSAGLSALLARGGDITQSVPLTLPPPEPAPTPENHDLQDWWTQVKPWATGRTFSATTKAGKAAHASIDLAKNKQLL